MQGRRLARRTVLRAAFALVAGGAATGGLRCTPREQGMLTVYTFGDSILDCGRYNAWGVTPGALLVRNDDTLFPAFRGQDLAAHGGGRLEHRARDGATVRRLPAQAAGLRVATPAVALLTIGGNDLLMGLVTDRGPGIQAFA